MNKPFYITTAIDYPNALPHIGTAFEKVGADVQARFRVLNNQNVYFLMGNDENTQKVARAALKWEPVDTQVYVNRMAIDFRHAWRNLGIGYSRFCQTSDPKHHAFCKNFLQKVYENGYIYSKHYEGLYCAECEEFKQTVINGECETHPGIQLQHRSERNYFFAQSRFKERLLQLYADKKIKIIPDFRQTEMLNFISADLKDISISRQNQGWGIPIPWDNTQVIYVWFDALLNYLTFADGHWPADVHVVGKDIVRFHGALFPAMIMAYNENVVGEKHGDTIALPHTIFSHGFICRRQGAVLTKFSKSGENLGPNGLVSTFGADGYRYLFMKTTNFADDGEYEFGAFAETYNADLVNKYGNLFSRVCKLAMSKLGGVIPPPKCGQKDLPINYALIDWWKSAMAAFQYRDALVACMDGIDTTNKLLEDRKPWADDAQDVPETLAIAARVLKTVSFLFAPVMPYTSRLVWDTLKYDGDPGFDHVCMETVEGYILSSLALTIAPERVQDGKVPILFPRYKIATN